MHEQPAHSGPNGSTPALDWPLLLQRHGRWLRLVLGARLHHAHEVDDAMQEIALTAIRRSDTLKDPDRVAPWLYRIAVHEVLQQRRAAGRRRQRDHLWSSQQRNAEMADPLDWLVSTETQELVQRGLSQLGAQDREILVLKHCEGWSYRRIAEQLGLTPDKVVYRLQRARTRLRNLLAALQTTGEQDQ